jgi:hypothetical protein
MTDQHLEGINQGVEDVLRHFKTVWFRAILCLPLTIIACLVIWWISVRSSGAPLRPGEMQCVLIGSTVVGVIIAAVVYKVVASGQVHRAAAEFDRLFSIEPTRRIAAIEKMSEKVERRRVGRSLQKFVLAVATAFPEAERLLPIFDRLESSSHTAFRYFVMAIGLIIAFPSLLLIHSSFSVPGSFPMWAVIPSIAGLFFAVGQPLYVWLFLPRLLPSWAREAIRSGVEEFNHYFPEGIPQRQTALIITSSMVRALGTSPNNRTVKTVLQEFDWQVREAAPL